MTVELTTGEIAAILDALNNRSLTYAKSEHISDHRNATIKMLQLINDLQLL